MGRIFGLMMVGVLSLSMAFAAEDEKKPASPEAAKQAFEADYDAGVKAAMEKNWDVARIKLATALKALGDNPHTNKSTAQVMLNKAAGALFKDDALVTANELMRLKQWAEAEEAYRKFVDVNGETEAIRNNVLACRKGLEAENADLKNAGELLKDKKWQEASDAYNKAAETLGTLRLIREGITVAQLNIEADALLKKAPEMLQQKKWDDAFKAYQRAGQILGETEVVKKGIMQARDGYADELKASAEKPEKLKAQ